MRRIILLLLMCLFLLTGILAGCGRLDEIDRSATTPAPVVVARGETVAGDNGQEQDDDEEPAVVTKAIHS